LEPDRLEICPFAFLSQPDPWAKCKGNTDSVSAYEDYVVIAKVGEQRAAPKEDKLKENGAIGRAALYLTVLDCGKENEGGPYPEDEQDRQTGRQGIKGPQYQRRSIFQGDFCFGYGSVSAISS